MRRLKWVAGHGQELGADGSRIAVAGNSVGGDMTAALDADGQGPQRTQDQLPGPADSGDRRQRRYGVLSRLRDRPLPDARLHEIRLGPLRPRREDPRQSLCVAAPGQHQQLKGLPPALVITAENCPLRDEGEAYARKMKEAGVAVDAVRYNGTIHDFVLLNALRHVPPLKQPSIKSTPGCVNTLSRQHTEQERPRRSGANAAASFDFTSYPSASGLPPRISKGTADVPLR